MFAWRLLEDRRRRGTIVTSLPCVISAWRRWSRLTNHATAKPWVGKGPGASGVAVEAGEDALEPRHWEELLFSICNDEASRLEQSSLFQSSRYRVIPSFADQSLF